MAGIALSQRDLTATREQLGQWYEHRFDTTAAVSELRPANQASGWSSESLIFGVTDDSGTAEYVVRIPPKGGGIFRDYDLQWQSRTQTLLGSHGVAAPSPTFYEPETSWLGSEFLVMPRIVGHTPSDVTYAKRGWLHDADTEVQRRAHDSFLDTLVAIQRVPVDQAPWLARPTGVGNGAELDWWRDYVEWGTDKQVPDVMVEAFSWLERHQPADPAEPVVCWGDTRMSNAIFDDSGQLIGALDWEQSCLCPAELDFGWWLATRRQSLIAIGLDADPELPGFDSRAQVIGRYEQMIGRPLRDLGWYETCAMVRMGCCILRMQALLRRTGQPDHGFLSAPVLPDWTAEAIRR